MTAHLLHHDPALLSQLRRHVADRRCVFFTGLPGTGKSLMLQQFALLAREHGRTVHTLQWDIARADFQAADAALRFPESDGITHPTVRQAVGLWVRPEIERWHHRHTGPEHLLLAEVPLVLGRFAELARQESDRVEELLASDLCAFLITIPTVEVRAAIERARVRDLAELAHQRDATSAAINVMRSQWHAVAEAARGLGMDISKTSYQYDPVLYRAVYQTVLRHRHHEPLPLSHALPVTDSVHAHDVAATELRADARTANFSVQLATFLPGGYDPTKRWYDV